MTKRVFNFSAGPAVLPLSVLQKAQEELVALPGVGMSVLEISHRSKTFEEINHRAAERLRQLLGVPEDYSILFLQGGARLQFAMVPMNLLDRAGATAEFVLTGTWGKAACEEAERLGQVRVVWDGKATNYDRTPPLDQLALHPDAAYVHITSNETIQGVQFPAEPETGDVPLVSDSSSDLLGRPIDVRKYGLIYACAQKNLGPAGVTVVILRNDLLERSSESLPSYLSYKPHAENHSLYNTPPSFAVYMVGLVAEWLQEEIGGLAAMEAINRRKAQMLYDAMDQSNGFYVGHAAPECRSIMNVPFRLPNEALDAQFLKEAEQHGLSTLKGHRSVGGVRASIYNAMPVEGVEALRDFMKDFASKHSG